MDYESLVRDQKHASFLSRFIQAKIKDGYHLAGCEVPFNHFGDRGVIDVVLRCDDPLVHKAVWWICEIKPALYDIGDTIRQVRRAEQYFCQARPDMNKPGWENEYRFVLVIDAQMENFQDMDKYRDLFQGIEVVYFNQNPEQIQQIKILDEIQQAISMIQRS
ncbi:MAG: hypothetical protein ACE15F_23805 [bacterium]